MTAVIQVQDSYQKVLEDFVKTLPEEMIKMTVVKNNLDEEIARRVAEIQEGKSITKPLNALGAMRERYVSH